MSTKTLPRRRRGTVLGGRDAAADVEQGGAIDLLGFNASINV